MALVYPVCWAISVSMMMLALYRVAPGATAKNVLIDGSPVSSSGPATTIDDQGTLESAEARNSPAMGGVSQLPPSGRALIMLSPGAKRVTLDNVHLIGGGFDTLVGAQGDVQYLAVTGSSVESTAAAMVKQPPAPTVGKSNKK